MLMAGARMMKLGLFHRHFGHHIAAWRHPAAPLDHQTSLRASIEIAATAERGLFDFLFEADSVTAQAGNDRVLHYMPRAARIEPLTMMSALAAATSQIGLVCTSTTTYDQPYFIARRFASLDLISGGRAGWNVVTSVNPAEAVNFGLDEAISKELRYRRAREFVEVVLGLWDSWDDDAFIRDRRSGRYFDPRGMHVLNHAGEHFRVRGPLNVPRSPQGRPVVVHAGSSEGGLQLAAETADVAFCVQKSLGELKVYGDDLRGRAVRYGREPDDIKVMPGLSFVVAPTRAEAEDKQAALDDLIVPETGLGILSTFLGYDVYDAPLDGPLPAPPAAIAASLQTRSRVLRDIAEREKLTVRQLYKRIAGGRGHNMVIGTPGDVADRMEEAFAAGAADGFNLMPALLPGSLGDFVELVVPELQRRKLFRTRYEGPTLREKLGLKWPARHAAHVTTEAAE
jgi:FMN-dependent oxidoreductase (nitrilotriacetate monooxygenase family)